MLHINSINSSLKHKKEIINLPLQTENHIGLLFAEVKTS
jgi:hypothetical protein